MIGNGDRSMETFHQHNPNGEKLHMEGCNLGFDDNHTDESFLKDMVTNTNVVKCEMLKVMIDFVSISLYLCIVTLVVLVWTYTLGSTINENSLLLLDACILGLGFFVLFLTSEMLSLNQLFNYVYKISFFITGLYVLSPIYHTLTQSISSDTIWALTVSLITFHLFLLDYSGSTVKAPGALEHPTLTSNISLNASIMASLLIASRVPSRLHVFASVVLLASFPLCTAGNILYKEMLILVAPLLLIGVSGGDIGICLSVEQITFNAVVEFIRFYNRGVSLLAHKDSRVQV